MLLGVQFPPEFFAEILGLAADAFEVIQVGGRDAFQLGAEPRHREGLKAVLLPCVVQVPLEESHQLASLGLALPPLGRLRPFLLKIGENIANGFHTSIRYL